MYGVVVEMFQCGWPNVHYFPGGLEVYLVERGNCQKSFKKDTYQFYFKHNRSHS